MDKSYRVRKIENVIEEIKLLQDDWNITYINFYDELLMSSVPRTTELCEAILENNLKIKWYCNGRLNYAKPGLLKLMKKSGCVYINYGVESLDNAVLKSMRKGLTENLIREGVQNTIDAEIDPGINIIFGNKGDNSETAFKALKFMLENCPDSELRTIRPVTPYPGSELFDIAVREGLLKDTEDFYKKHVNSDLLTVNFTDLPDSEVYEILCSVNTSLVDTYYSRMQTKHRETIKGLYNKLDPEFRGFRQA